MGVAMIKRRRVILYGKSVILGTVGASLACYPDLEIVALSPPLPDVEALEALAPDVVLFDFDLGQPEPIFTLLKDHPNLLLVGVNPENEQVKLWSSAKGAVVTVDDLFQLISKSFESEEAPQDAENLYDL
jgi:hypothetical protein